MNAQKVNIKFHRLYFIPKFFPPTPVSGGKQAERSSWRQPPGAQICFSVSNSVLQGEVPKYSHVLLSMPPAGLNVALEIGPQFSSLHLEGGIRISTLWPYPTGQSCTCLVLTARWALLQLSENGTHREPSTLAGVQQTFSVVVSDTTLKARTQVWFARGGHWVLVSSSFQYPNSLWPLGLSSSDSSVLHLSQSYAQLEEDRRIQCCLF